MQRWESGRGEAFEAHWDKKLALAKWEQIVIAAQAAK